MTIPQDEQALIEFPCDFSIKVMGQATQDFEKLVLTQIADHIDDVEAVRVKSRLSKGERYISLTLTINVTSRDQLDNIYRSLTAHEDILYVL